MHHNGFSGGVGMTTPDWAAAHEHFRFDDLIRHLSGEIADWLREMAEIGIRFVESHDLAHVDTEAGLIRIGWVEIHDSGEVEVHACTDITLEQWGELSRQGITASVSGPVPDWKWRRRPSSTLMAVCQKFDP